VGSRPAANALVISGLVVTTVTLVVPFATNDAGCLERCARDAGSYFFAHPLHNVGAPFSLVGIAASIALWRSAAWRRRGLTWLASCCGWIGVALLYRVTPDVIDDLYIKGGPPLETTAALHLVPLAWILLWTGALLASPAPLHPEENWGSP
jgi:hypothetical protein